MAIISILILIFISSVNICHSQQSLHLQKGDSAITIVLGTSPYYYNVIREESDSLIFYDGDAKKRSNDLIEVVLTNLSDSTSLVQWINTRDNAVIQKGVVNVESIADGEFITSYYGDSSKTLYVDGYKNRREWYTSDGTIFVHEFLKGRLHGVSYQLSKGKFLEKISEYSYGVKHGFDRGYWIGESGSSIHYSDIYINGKIKDGKSKVYNPDGSVFVEQDFKNGLLHGFLKVFGYDGSIMRMEKYRKGKLLKVYKLRSF